MIRLDAATVLLQWATGGLAFLWVTTRHREVGLGYGWLLRGTYLLLAVGALAIGGVFGDVPVRQVSALGVALATSVALISSIRRKAAGVAGQQSEHDRRSARVATMTGIERSGLGEGIPEPVGKEFDPRLDLVAPCIGIVGLVAAGLSAGGNDAVAVARTLVGAAFLGCITDAMLLGHWYLVQPGLPRRLLVEMVRIFTWVWPLEVLVMLLPTGMISVLNGSVDDGWGGVLGWTWVVCALTTIGLVIVTRMALKERQYSAVMAATGLLYLAILTAFGTDLIARAVLAS